MRNRYLAFGLIALFMAVTSWPNHASAFGTDGDHGVIHGWIPDGVEDRTELESAQQGCQKAAAPSSQGSSAADSVKPAGNQVLSR